MTIRSSTSIQRAPGSFRDPHGFVFYRNEQIYRAVLSSFADQFQKINNSGFFSDAIKKNLLVRHSDVAPEGILENANAYKLLLHDKIDFISYPYEWCFSQLKDAALLTLNLHRLALDYNLALKDASAYNVQFSNGRPIFIDTLSFETYSEGTPWVAYQQFCKHFLAPLALMAHTHVDLIKLFQTYIDGIPLELASCLLPWKTRLHLGIGVHIFLHARAQKRHARRVRSVVKARRQYISKTAMLGLVDSLENTIHKLHWVPEGTEWASYYDSTNYHSGSEESKLALVGAFIDEAAPCRIWDLGANIGKYSRIGSERGIFTVALDIDHAAVEKNYRQVRLRGEKNLLPLIMDFANPSPSRGWDGDERDSIFDRGPTDLVMALAIIHHIAIGNNVPLDRVARWLARLGQWLIIEFVPKGDSQVQRLLATREDIFCQYTKVKFESEFSKYFKLHRCAPIIESKRILYLMKKL